MNSVELALTWTLIHSLWIAFAVWLMTSFTGVFFKKPETQRLLKIGGMCVFSLTMIGLFVYQLLPQSIINITANATLVQQSTEGGGISVLAQKIDSSVLLGSEIIPKLWMLGLIYGVARLLYSRRSLTRYRKTAIPCFDERVNASFTRISQKLNIKRKGLCNDQPTDQLTYVHRSVKAFRLLTRRFGNRLFFGGVRCHFHA